jgi:very-short-patch-repair endonuclease
MAGPVRWQRASRPLLEAAWELRTRQTPMERRLWEQLRARRLDGLGFRRQQPIGPYIVDFYCSAAKLVVEVDGGIHEEQVEYDGERDSYLAAHGLRVLRFTNEAVLRDLESVLAAIRSATAKSLNPLLSRGGSPPAGGGEG